MRAYDYHQLNVGEQDYRPRRKGLGIRNAIKRKTAAMKDSDAFGQWFFRTIVKAGPLTKWGPTDALIHGVAMMGGTHSTKGHSMPLYIDMDECDAAGSAEPAHVATAVPAVGVEAAPHTSKTLEMDQQVFGNVQKVQPPVEMMKDAVRRASYRAIMNECLCRKIQGCTDYPIDLGCLFIGPAAHVCVENGIAREATLQECFDHIDRAAACGLSAAAYFVEVEEYVWGFHDEDMPNFLEFCFCCPCCCSATLFEHRAGGELKRILHQGIGWSAVIDADRCVGCGACVALCPHDDVMHIENGHVTIGDTCAGCGQCFKGCAHDAIHVRHTGTTKPRVEDYFEHLHAAF